MTGKHSQAPASVKKEVLRLIRDCIVPFLRRDEKTRALLRPLRSRGIQWEVELDEETTRHHVDNRESYWVKGQSPSTGDILEFVVQKVIDEGDFLPEDESSEERFGHNVAFELIVGKHSVDGMISLNLDGASVTCECVTIWDVVQLEPVDSN